MLLSFLMPDLTTCLVALGVFLVVYLLWTSRLDPRFPPSAITPLPILGHILFLEQNPRKQFFQWRKKCGDIFSVYVGNSLMVVVNGYDALKEIFVKRADVSSDRPVFFTDGLDGSKEKGVVLSSGGTWKEQRSTMLSILRNFGMGKDRLAQKIQEEIDCYIERVAHLREQNDQRDISEFTYEAVSNIIHSIITGQRFNYGDPLFKDLIEKMNANVRLSQSMSLLHVFPFLRHLPGDLFHANEILANMKSITDMYGNRFLKSKGAAEYDENNIDNFIAAYIFERNKKTNAGLETYLNDENLLKNINDLFAAGTETTSTTITWCLLYILHHPEIQEKVYQEIIREVGQERRPNMADKSRLTYLNAVIRETQRLANIVPLSVPHRSSAEFTYNGYTIPKGAQLVPNLYSVLYDKSVWGEDAEKFRPERFIDSKGNLLNPQEFLPFSLGRRVCLGESLAKMELFLFLAALFQRFKFLAVDPASPPTTEPIFGFTAVPVRYEAKIIDRLANQSC